MENIYAKLLELPKNVEYPNYYQLLGVKEGELNNDRIENNYKKKLQKLQRVGNNPKYKDTVLFLKGQLRKAFTTITQPTSRTEYDLVLLSQKIEEIERDIRLFLVKGYIEKKELLYLKKHARVLKIPKPRIQKILGKLEPYESKSKFHIAKHFDISNIIKFTPLKIHIFGLFVGVIAILVSMNIAFYLRMSYLKEKLNITQKNTILTMKNERKTKNEKTGENERKIEKKKIPYHIKRKLVYIPSGVFFMGNVNGNQDERPERNIYIDAFYIKKYEVTNREYREFVRATNYPVPYLPRRIARSFNWDPLNKDYPEGMGNYPVVLVSWYDAKEYCRWLSKKTGLDVSLPSEAQWEKAARGNKKYSYPWGNAKPNSKRANFASKRLLPVGSFPQGNSPFGVSDMAGNVWEWCLDSYDKFAYQKILKNNPVILKKDWPWKCLRGGSWQDSAVLIRSTYRFAAQSDQLDIRWGFRYIIAQKK